MPSGLVRTFDDDGIRTVTLHRPEKRNALSRAMQVDLCDVLAAADQDAAVRAVVLTGTDPAFCAGLDFTDRDQFADRYGNQFRHHPARALRAMTKPVVCAVNGACVSGGLEVALSASFIVASDRASFADTHARLGVVPTWGLTALLPRAVGVRRARELSVTGRTVPAAEAAAIGLANHVVPHEQLLAFTHALVRQVPATTAVRDVLRLYDRAEAAAVAAPLEMEWAAMLDRPFDAEAFAAAGRDVARRS
ncbi:enoyl-CoA hydratase-related protein [Dactylosporangium sucinum]|uniref:Enoyl-CoA hydratase n=1 Tax=Dactylosporangium sucinum TaxID=1424081 RepID=A0A917UCU0_9ACTN|nr:enoyl-CoA hydratase-related protein [Dactylosporangium sucinum]GGM75457.1 enoyl-CoA hydratase [Dactylosporangium sucinum]